jgi:hypothetical protein
MKKNHLLLCSIVASIFIFNQAHALRFERACDRGDSIIIGAVGDVLLHGPLQKQGYAQGFDSLWKEIEEYMFGVDIMYANLEGPAALGVAKGGKNVKDPGPVFQNYVHSGYPAFNYHPSIVESLKMSGVDILSTANNHAMDRGNLGALRTIETMEKFNMPFMGSRKDSSHDYNYIMDRDGWRIAWIACSFSTNGLPDKNDMILDCYDTGRVSKYIKELKDKVDAVIVTPHWGNEYQNKPHSSQTKFGRQWLEDGATAVIGAHPHVPQPWEKYKTADGREGMIIYSLGNFVSNQSGTAKQSSLILFLGLSKNGGKAWVNGVRYIPLFMKRKPYSIEPSNVSGGGNEMAASLKHVRGMFGEERMVNPGETIITNGECE